jgi:hypothetical protein
MAYLVQKTTASAIQDLLSHKKQVSHRLFSPLPSPGELEVLPWRVRWWAPDGCASVYIPPTGAIVGMALDLSNLSESTDLDDAAATPLSHWYKAARIKSTVDSVESVWLVLSGEKVDLCLARETPGKEKYPNLTAVIELAVVTIVERNGGILPGAPESVTFSDAVVSQKVLGALSFGGASASVPLAWRVRLKSSEGSSQTWEVYHPCWQCGRVSYFAEGGAAGHWVAIPSESVAAGPLYAVLEELGKQQTNDSGQVTGVEWAVERVFLTTKTADIPADTLPTRYGDGRRFKTVVIGAFARASMDTGDQTLAFTQYHEGVIVEDVASDGQVSFSLPSAIYFDVASMALKERVMAFNGSAFVETGEVRTLLQFSPANLGNVVHRVNNTGDALKQSFSQLLVYSPNGAAPAQGAAQVEPIIGLTPREANESSPYGGAGSSSEV